MKKFFLRWYLASLLLFIICVVPFSLQSSLEDWFSLTLGILVGALFPGTLFSFVHKWIRETQHRPTNQPVSREEITASKKSVDYLSLIFALGFTLITGVVFKPGVIPLFLIALGVYYVAKHLNKPLGVEKKNEIPDA